MSYYNYCGNTAKTEFFQKRLKSLLSLRQVDDKLELVSRTSKRLHRSANFAAPPINFKEQRRIDQALQKSALEANIKDNMITRDLKYQETVITSRLAKQSELAAHAILVEKDGQHG